MFRNFACRSARALAVGTAAILALGWIAAMGAVAAGLPEANPESVGLSADRLKRIGTALESEIQRGRLPGAVALVARRGKIAYWEAFGVRDPANGSKMQKDDIFRIYSMTKPITTVSLMMLVEEGKILLTDPVSKYIPAFKQMQVAMPKADGSGGVTMVPMTREITVHDLLRHTSGLTYGFRTTLVKKQWEEASAAFPDLTNAEVVDRISKLPLAFQPGTIWEYSVSVDVVGRLVEIVSGQTLGQYFEQRVLKPLRMTDTGFAVPAAQAMRLAQPGPDPDTGKPQPMFDAKVVRKYESGGGGGVSTAGDYVRLAQMLLNGGQLDGVRLLSPKTVAWMTSDHLQGISRASADYLPGPGYTFGLGFAVRETQGVSPLEGSVGEYNWGGAGGTFFWVDPKEQLIGVLMVQAPSQRVYLRSIFKNLVVQAIVN